MAKQQSFGDKNKKKEESAFKTVKFVFSVRSEKTGAIRFSEKFVKLPKDGDESKVLAEAMN
ncbi:MAG: hypothetical protein HGB19_13900 [Chlorobiales bacterium]|nr:hypothetical protein [Chlorobiales bacterium]